MNQVTLQVYSIQKTIDPEFIEHLETLVQEHGYNVKKVLPLDDEAIESPQHGAADPNRDDITEWQKELKEMREKIGPIKSDSALYIRELRDNP